MATVRWTPTARRQFDELQAAAAGDKGVQVQLPQKPLDPIATVVVLEIEGDAKVVE